MIYLHIYTNSSLRDHVSSVMSLLFIPKTLDMNERGSWRVLATNWQLMSTKNIRLTNTIVTRVKIMIDRPCLMDSSDWLTACQAWTTLACCCFNSSKSLICRFNQLWFNSKLEVSQVGTRNGRVLLHFPLYYRHYNATLQAPRFALGRCLASHRH